MTFKSIASFFLMAGMAGALFPCDAYALPTGGAVTAGDASISPQSDTALSVHQTTDRAIIQWDQFNIASNEQVSFVQPSPDAVALNRIVGGDPSSILGQLSANGHLFLVNPEGIFFGPTATLNVGGLVATTFDLKDSDFLSGKETAFTIGGSSGAVVNEGLIAVSDGGFVFFIAPSVTNAGAIHASGGEVVLETRGGDPLSALVNQSGIIEAKSLVNQSGVIRLVASSPVVNTGLLGAQTHLREVQNPTGNIIQSGTLDVSAVEPGATSGEITLSGATVTLSGSLLASGEGARVLVTSSDKTVLTENALIDTSGTGYGNAGNSVIWSDRQTFFAGTVLAQGGETGGNGGAVEVSGYDWLGYKGRVDASALQGTPGSLLLDPKNIIVQPGGSGSLSNNPLGFNVDPTGNATINASAITDITKNGTGVTLQAHNDITVNENIITDRPPGLVGGSLSLQAGRSIIINANITTDGGLLTLSANEKNVNGVNSDNRDAGAAVVTMAAGTTLDAGGANIVITMSTGNNDPGKSTSGDITLANLTTLSHIEITNNGLTSGSDILRQGSTSLIAGSSAVFDVVGSASIGTKEAPIRVALTAGVEARSLTGGVFLEGVFPGDITVGGAALAGAKNISGISSTGIVSVTVAGNLTIDEPISAGGTIDLSAIGLGKKIISRAAITGPASVTLRADQIDLQPGGVINSGAGGGVTLRPDTIGRGIDLGNKNVGTTLELSDTELDQITTTGVLQIGAPDSGAIEISDPINTATVTNLALISANAITQTASLTEQNLRVESVGAVTLTNTKNDVETIAGSVSGTGNALQYTDSNDIVIGTVSGLTGLKTNGGAIAVTVAGEGKTLINSAAVTGSPVTFTADQIVLQTSGAINAGAGNVTLIPNTSGRPIILGNTVDSGSLVLSGAGLNTITTTGTLRIGNATSGGISIADPINTARVTTTVLAGNGITQTETGVLIEETLRIESVGDVRLIHPNNDVVTLTGSVTGSGASFDFTDANTISIGSEGVVAHGGGAVHVIGRVLFDQDQNLPGRFQSDYAPQWMDQTDKVFSVVTERFIAPPENRCKLDKRLAEEVGRDIC
jgi:filamentous hemagglutinin family protein